MTQKRVSPAASANAVRTQEIASAAIPENNKRVAENLAEVGFSVFPCGPDKRPRVTWRDASTSDVDAVRAMWRRVPGLPAIDLAKCNIVAIDLDRHTGGNDGVAAFKRLAQPHGLPRGVPIVRTAGNGVHLYFRQPEGVEPFGNSKGALPAGIDVRGHGGFVVAPGAMLQDGRQWRLADGSPDLAGAYQAGTIPPLPQWLCDLIRPQRPAPKSRPMHWTSASADRERVYVEAALRYISSDDRCTWFCIGGALHDAGFPRELWDWWSSSSSKFDEKTQAKTWASFSRPSRRVAASIGTIIALARRNGFQGKKYGRAA